MEYGLSLFPTAALQLLQWLPNVIGLGVGLGMVAASPTVGLVDPGLGWDLAHQGLRVLAWVLAGQV